MERQREGGRGRATETEMGDLRNAKRFILRYLVLPRSPQKQRSQAHAQVCYFRLTANDHEFYGPSSHPRAPLRCPALASPPAPHSFPHNTQPLWINEIRESAHRITTTKQNPHPNVPKILSLTNTLPTVAKRSCEYHRNSRVWLT